MISLLRRLTTDASGATAIEYALIAALVCLAPFAAFGAGGDAIVGLINQAAHELVAAGPDAHLNVLPPADLDRNTLP